MGGEKQRDAKGRFLRMKPGSGARLWRPCRVFSKNADPKLDQKHCRNCGRTASGHRDLSVASDWPATFEAARKYAGMSLPEWDAADDHTRARAVALMQEDGYRQAYAREAAHSAENGVFFGDREHEPVTHADWAQG